MKNYRFTIIVGQDEDGYFVSRPELQGCYRQGDTYEQAIENIRDAMQLHIADRLERQEELPKALPVSIGTVEVAV